MSLLIAEQRLALHGTKRTLTMTPGILRENNVSGTLPVVEPAPQVSFTIGAADLAVNEGFKSFQSKMVVAVGGKNTDALLAHTVNVRLYKNAVLDAVTSGSVPANNFWGASFVRDAAQGDFFELAMWADLVLVVTFDRSFIQSAWTRPIIFESDRVLRELTLTFGNVPNATPAGWSISTTDSWEMDILDTDTGTGIPGWAVRMWGFGPVKGLGRLRMGDFPPDNRFASNVATRPFRRQSMPTQATFRPTSLEV